MIALPQAAVSRRNFIGEDYLRRMPLHPDMIVTALETKTRTHKPLMAYI
jgi:hypothetical protein